MPHYRALSFSPQPGAAIAAAAILALLTPAASSGADADISIEFQGHFVRECSLPGETRADDVVPRHANAIQLSRERWLVLYSTHGYRGVDDERSIVYQIRRDAPDGAVMKEGLLSRGIEGWMPPGAPAPEPGWSHYKQHGHMVAFGVPKGALSGGRLVPHANLFVAKWRVLGRPLNLRTGFLEKAAPDSPLFNASRGVEWVQFRLNEREDDIEILQPASLLRQKGHESGPRFCEGEPVGWMNQSFCPAVPTNADASEWADANHFDGERVAVLGYRYDPATHRYEWVRMSPLIGAVPGRRFFEASLVPLPDGWLIGARGNGAVAWTRARTLFETWPAIEYSQPPAISAPMTVFRCADGVVRLFSGDKTASPTGNPRDPLYCWDILPDQRFQAVNRREIFSTIAARLPIRPESQVKVDFCELFPLHGRSQLIVFGISTRAMNHLYPNQPTIPIQNEAEKNAAGLYYARLTYRTDPPPLWTFSGTVAR